MPADAFDELFDRERLLSGLPERRAATVLFLIEGRTARLAARSRQAMRRLAGREAAERRELAYVEAFALGREPPRRPTVQDLELHAREWAALVPRNPRVQAALAHRLGEKHPLPRERVPGIRTALGLDDPRVADAFAALYDRPVDSVFAPRTSIRERRRWVAAATTARFDRLSPFWTAYALTLTETVGSTIVALPIAVAAVGPMPAIGILVVLGLVNVLTVALMADALTRTRTMRFGDAYIGRVVTDLLGRTGAFVLTAGLVAICLLGMEADYIGVSSTLSSAFGAHELVWVTLMFAVELWYLRRGSIDATVTSALVVGAINIALILAISGLAFWHLDPGNLSHVDLPFVSGNGSDVTSLGLVFGVTFTAYFGHLSVSNCARVVLARDPSGGSLMRGVVAAQLTAIVLYVLFVLAVTGAVSPGTLARETGTALEPLSDQAGPAVLAFGGILVVLGMGMASIHSGLALFYLVQERLPARGPRTLVLPRRGARAVLAGRGADRTRIALTYEGRSSAGARFRVEAEGADGRVRSGVATAGTRWSPLTAAPLAELGSGAALELTILAATEHDVRFEVRTTMRLRYDGAYDTSAASLTDLLAATDEDAAIVAWLLRHPESTVADVAAHEGVEPSVAAERLERLTDAGLITTWGAGDGRRFGARPGRRRPARLPVELLGLLDGPGDEAEGPARPAAGAAPPTGLPAPGRRGALAEAVRDRLSGDRARLAAGVAPVVVVFAGAVWQSLAGEISLADVLSVLGVVVVALLAGVFPVLLNLAGRNRGELLGWGYRVPAQRWVLGAVYGFSLAAVALHGLVLWDDLPRRITALGVVALALVMTWSMVRGGAFRPGATIELRHDDASGTTTFHAVDAGRPGNVAVALDYADGTSVHLEGAQGPVADLDGLRRATFMPGGPAEAGRRASSELAVWVHRITEEDDSVALDAHLETPGDAVDGVPLDEDGVARVPGDGAVVSVVFPG
ncbi:hypothetical protein [Patulibacter minatonensis]|uniref:hypothetical protein n=1 Tax=Patulibacter minatonensis TaxID=298163 RepID=UPI00047D5B15|nr:hypothetical protein [Patulibacter minatonensis]